MVGRITKGRRLPVGEGDTFDWPERPGEYVGPVRGAQPGQQVVYFLKPNARDEGAPRAARSVQCVVSPPHQFRECEDGSLEIRESIGDTTGGGTSESDGWHGYLGAGHIWRQV